MPINSIEGLDASTYPEQSLETPAHLNFLKQPVPCLNSPLHKLHHGLGWYSKLLNGLRAAASGALYADVRAYCSHVKVL